MPPELGQTPGIASAAEISDGRFTTRPNAPSAACSQSSTTDRAKFGSTSCGIESSRVGASDITRDLNSLLSDRVELVVGSDEEAAAGYGR